MVLDRQTRQANSYNPTDYGWLEVAYSPTELDNLPPGLKGWFSCIEVILKFTSELKFNMFRIFPLIVYMSHNAWKKYVILRHQWQETWKKTFDATVDLATENWRSVTKRAISKLSFIELMCLGFDGATRNYEFNQQLLDALSTLDASFRRSLETGDFSGLENNNLQAVENTIIYALSVSTLSKLKTNWPQILDSADHKDLLKSYQKVVSIVFYLISGRSQVTCK